jgi:hypothetical protein
MYHPRDVIVVSIFTTSAQAFGVTEVTHPKRQILFTISSLVSRLNTPNSFHMSHRLVTRLGTILVTLVQTPSGVSTCLLGLTWFNKCGPCPLPNRAGPLLPGIRFLLLPRKPKFDPALFILSCPIKPVVKAGCLWLILIIRATWEAEIGRIMVQN